MLGWLDGSLLRRRGWPLSMPIILFLIVWLLTFFKSGHKHPGFSFRFLGVSMFSLLSPITMLVADRDAKPPLLVAIARVSLMVGL